MGKIVWEMCSEYDDLKETKTNTAKVSVGVSASGKCSGVVISSRIEMVMVTVCLHRRRLAVSYFAGLWQTVIRGLLVIGWI